MLDVRQDPSQRVATLDGLRGVAVLLVLTGHFVVMSPPLWDAAPRTIGAYIRIALSLPTGSGVDLFFVLSGFLVGGILIRHRDSSSLLSTFFARRFLRIVPLAMLCIAADPILVALGWLAPEAPLTPWWAHVTFSTNLHFSIYPVWDLGRLTPFWSVAIEEQFYLTLPWLVLLWPRRRLYLLGPSLIGVALVSRALLVQLAPEFPTATFFLTPCRFDAFGLGITAASLVQSKHWAGWKGLGSKRWAFLIPPGIGGAYLIKTHAGMTDVAMATWGHLAIAAFCTVMLLLAYEPQERWLKQLLESKLLRLFGLYSYFIYLFQNLLARPLVGLVFHGDPKAAVFSQWYEIVAVPLVLLPPAMISWRLFEQPLIRLGRRLTY